VPEHGRTDGNENAEAVIRAARDMITASDGIRDRYFATYERHSVYGSSAKVWAGSP